MGKNNENTLVRVSDVAFATGLSTSLLTNLADSGKIPCVRPNLGGNRYYNIPEVMRALGFEHGEQESSEDSEKSCAARSQQRESVERIGAEDDTHAELFEKDGEFAENARKCQRMLELLREGRRYLDESEDTPTNLKAKAFTDFLIQLAEAPIRYENIVNRLRVHARRETP